jgi:hypothetical protein
MKASFTSKSVTTLQDQCNAQYKANFEAYKAKQLQGNAKAVAKRQANKALIAIDYIVPDLEGIGDSVLINKLSS